MASPWDGLGSVGDNLMSLYEQRRAEELKKKEDARQDQELILRRQAQEAELAQRAQEAAQRQQQHVQQQQQYDRQTANQDANAYDTKTPYSPEMVDRLQKTGQQGMIRTVGAGQTELPSTQWQGDMYTKRSNAGVVEGMYRPMNPAERQREDDQKARQDDKAEDYRFRDRQSQATRESSETQRQLDREAAAERARENNDTRRDITNAIQAGKQPPQGPAPYFTQAPIYDAQGRPIGVQRFDARTGTLEPIPGAGLTKPPPGDLGKQSIMNETSLDQLDRLEEMFKKKSGLTGPAAGRINTATKFIPGVDVDPDFAELDAASAAFTNSVIKAITGAALGEQEAQRIMGQIPGKNDKPVVWLAKAKQTRANLLDLENRMRTDRGTGAAPASQVEKWVRGPDGRLVKQGAK